LIGQSKMQCRFVSHILGELLLLWFLVTSMMLNWFRYLCLSLVLWTFESLCSVGLVSSMADFCFISSLSPSTETKRNIILYKTNEYLTRFAKKQNQKGPTVIFCLDCKHFTNESLLSRYKVWCV